MRKKRSTFRRRTNTTDKVAYSIRHIKWEENRKQIRDQWKARRKPTNLDRVRLANAHFKRTGRAL